MKLDKDKLTESVKIRLTPMQYRLVEIQCRRTRKFTACWIRDVIKQHLEGKNIEFPEPKTEWERWLEQRDAQADQQTN